MQESGIESPSFKVFLWVVDGVAREKDCGEIIGKP
jgi:hypothetical protein